MRRFRITVNGTVYEVEAEEMGAETRPAPPAPAATKPAPASSPSGTPTATGTGGTVVTAPLPGMVLDVKVLEGSLVESGQTVAILEAMKMENEIAAPISGHVTGVRVTKGTAVNAGDVLLTIGG
ncbi:MAG: biotin/lipoyl-binding protein [Thermaerobacter sp.]|nr:biotin/lipoyl-binding protein [Thermaerobacter sp.]